VTAANGRRLVDDEARRRIGEDLDSTLFVEAGAGSGKTTALVGRIVALLRTGRATMREIAAITFTEAAASELRLRVRESLLEATAGPLDDAERARCEGALASIDEAPISTIHGFCQRLLAAHPIEAGLPPQIEVMDEIGESIAWRARWSRQLDRMAADPDLAALVGLAWMFGATPPRIEQLGRGVDDRWHLSTFDPPDVAAVMARCEQHATGALSAYRRAVAAAIAEREACRDDADRLVVQLEALALQATELDLVTRWQDGVRLLLDAAPLKYKGGRAANWPGGIEEVRALVEEVASRREELLTVLRDHAFRTLAHLLESSAHEAAAERKRAGRLTFHDLLVFARDLLEGHPGALAAVRRRYRYLLIDEFQDTDPLQLEIAQLIGRETGRASDSDSVAVAVGATVSGEGWEAGRCFFVGDPKQSIYRFRGADLEAYEAARGAIVGDDITRLTSNFRSSAGIIEFVNACFAELLGERFQRLDPARSADTAVTLSPPLAVVNVVGGAFAGPMKRSQQRKHESEDCCRAIETAVDRERWPVWDPVAKAVRPARYGDVAILVPRRTGLAELEAALDAHGVGYRVESASLIFASQEVRDLLALARALDTPGDHAAIVATLRSPAYSIGDDELVRWRDAGGSWDTEPADIARWPEEARTAAPVVAGALEDLAALREALPVLGPVGALAAAVRERRLMALVADRPRGRETWRRIRFLLDRARAFMDGGGRGLAEFADWIDEQVGGGLRSAESLVPEADEDVVRIMTVHGAKGLEFPITVLCGFGTSDSTRRSELVLRSADGPTEVHFAAGLRTSGYGEIEEGEQLRGREEEARLLYVAATRARDHLVICGHHLKGKEAAPQTLGEQLLEAAERASVAGSVRVLASHLDGEPEPEPEPEPAAEDDREARDQAEARDAGDATPAGGGLAGITTAGDLEAWRAGRARLVEAAGRSASVRATEIPHLAGLVGDQETDDERDEERGAGLDAAPDDENALTPSRPQHRGRGGAQVGRAVHAVLQTVALDDARELGRDPSASEPLLRLSATAALQARSERVPDRHDEVTRLALAALRSPVVSEAFWSGRARRETYVSTRIGEMVLDGFVDLCFVDGSGGLVVVDYKTDSVRNAAEVATRAEAYELQIAAYAAALGDATGRPITKCVLVFLTPPTEPIEHELSGAALAARIATVRTIVKGLVS
jgi:ATP-dependent exoDNAse (exonuclease V) beta subunit